MNAYEMLLTDVTGNDIKVQLRLNLNGQMELKKKYKKPTMETMFEATSDIEIMADVLTQCLNFKGNENVIKRGGELYDLIVENGKGGMRAWQKLLGDIMLVSGLYDNEELEMYNKKIDKTFGEIFEEDEKNQ